MSRIAVGVIRKAHGIRGEASVEAWTNSLERFEELADVTLVSPDEAETREARIESVRYHGDRALVKFAGIDAPEALSALRDWTVEIPEEAARTLEKDEYFLHDLVGLRLVDREGRDRGEVTDAVEGAGGVLLSVRRGDGGSFDLPFVGELCVEIDLPARRMLVELPEGLDDLDAVED